MARQKQVSSNSDVLLYFIAIFLPPLPVFIKRGCGTSFWLNLLLSLIIWLPGVIHAWFVISKHEDVKQQPQYIHAGYQQPHGSHGGPPPPPPPQQQNMYGHGGYPQQQPQHGYPSGPAGYAPPGQPAKKY